MNIKPPQPRKIVCIGRNYVAHIEELGNEVPDEMVVFVKPGSALTDRLSAFHQEPLHYECELCLKIEGGRIAALGLGLDLTKRQLQSQLRAKGLPWERSKAFDGSVVLSDFINLKAWPQDLRFELWVDGELRQQGQPEFMIYKPQQILAELKTFMKLEDGDVVMTGTPAGVGEIQAGESFEAKLWLGEELVLSKTWLAE